MKNYNVAKWVIDEIIFSSDVIVSEVTPSGLVQKHNRFDMLAKWVERWYMEGLITQKEYTTLIEYVMKG